jgi:hypothetical protein
MEATKTHLKPSFLRILLRPIALPVAPFYRNLRNCIHKPIVMNMINQFFFVIAIFFATTLLQAQNVGINTTGAVADPSAMLDVLSTTSGVLIPRMTDVQRVAIAAPQNGLLVYQTNANAGFWYFNGTIWVNLCSNSLYNNMYQAVGTGGVTLVTVGTFLALPGCTQTVTLTGNAKVFVHLDAGLQTSSGAVNGFTVADFVIAQNGFFLGNGGYKRITATNNTGLVTNLEACAMDVILTLPAGTYTYQAYSSLAGGAAGFASGNNTSVLQGMLSVIVVYQ